MRGLVSPACVARVAAIIEFAFFWMCSSSLEAGTVLGELVGGAG